MANLRIVRGDTVNLAFAVADESGDPFNLAGCSLEWTATNGTQTLQKVPAVTDAAAGLGTITIDAGDTANWPDTVTPLSWMLVVTDAGAVYTVATGSLAVSVALPQIPAVPAAVGYATRTDLIAALSQDSQARLSTDPLRKWNLGLTTGGATTRYATPYVESTTVRVYLDDVEQTTGWSLAKGTGTDGEDEVVFSAPPASGKRIAVTADKDAINAAVLDEVLEDVTDDMNAYLTAFLPITDATMLGVLRAKAVVLARVKLRERRNLEVSEQLARSWKAAMSWLEKVASGDFPLPITAPTTSSDGVSYGSEDPVFSDGGLI